MLLFPKRDDDNTPQGKLAHGTMVLVWFFFAMLFFTAGVDVIAHGVCYYVGSDCRTWECGWFRSCG